MFFFVPVFLIKRAIKYCHYQNEVLLLGMETTTTPKRRGRPNTPLSDPPNRLRELRIAGGYTLEQIAVAATASKRGRVSAPAILKAEIKGTGLGFANWFKIASFLGVDAEYLCLAPEK